VATALLGELDMLQSSTAAVVLRRLYYGDYDVILTVMTPDQGKRVLIAKSAKKSTKRFAGILEPFTQLQVVFNDRGGSGMPVLQEATLIRPFAGIRTDIVKTAYASYWTELILLWVEEAQSRPEIYHLLDFALGELADSGTPAMDLSVLFQMRFLGQEGFQPVLEKCSCCRKDIDELTQDKFCIDLTKGGIVCNQCPANPTQRLHLTKGTLKQLQWTVKEEFSKAKRIRFGKTGLEEATQFLEAFVPYHFGRQPKSLPVLQQVRRNSRPS
jgi:DNA repair protein RecO (recombination protein O)